MSSPTLSSLFFRRFLPFLPPGGKGTPRRKVVKKSTTTIQGDDRKVQTALKKLNVQPVAGVEEVNMFKDDGNVLHFAAPKGEVVVMGSAVVERRVVVRR
jgi:hypothetical protein